jgi:hypothetical protein
MVAALRCAARPGPASVAALGALVAIQVSTLAGEIVLQTAAASAFLAARSLGRRALAAGAAAAGLAALLAAPVLLGAAALIAGTRRGRGFAPAEILIGSLSPIELGGTCTPSPRPGSGATGSFPAASPIS